MIIMCLLKFTKVSVERGMSFSQANDIWRKYTGVDDGFYISSIVSHLSYISFCESFVVVSYIAGQGSYIPYTCTYVGNHFEYMHIYIGESMSYKDKIVSS